MKFILPLLLLCFLTVSLRAQTAEQRIRNYLTGFEKKDWNMVANQFTEDFNFTSPAGDVHISLTTYKVRCFPTSQFFKKVEFAKIMVEGDHAFAIYDITTTDSKIVHNVEYYTFSKGKIKSIECFFGAGIGYPGSTKKFN